MDNQIQGMLPTVWCDGGVDGRVMVADSLSYYEHEPWLNDVALGASFAGAPTGAMALRGGVKGWIAHEGGPGKDDAGVSGLPLAQKFGIPAAAIATNTARLSGGMSLVTGIVSRANEAAMALGVRPGQTGGEAGKLMLRAPPGISCNLDGLIDESIHEVVSTPDGNIFAVWSFSRVQGEHPRDVFCVASHGGKVMAQYALKAKPRGLIANDAGKGLDNSGMDGLEAIGKICRIPAATVSADSARIGDALSTYHDGVISGMNDIAKALGIQIGMKARDAAAIMLKAHPNRTSVA